MVVEKIERVMQGIFDQVSAADITKRFRRYLGPEYTLILSQSLDHFAWVMQVQKDGLETCFLLDPEEPLRGTKLIAKYAKETLRLGPLEAQPSTEHSADY